MANSVLPPWMDPNTQGFGLDLRSHPYHSRVFDPRTGQTLDGVTDIRVDLRLSTHHNPMAEAHAKLMIPGNGPMAGTTYEISMRMGTFAFYYDPQHPIPPYQIVLVHPDDLKPPTGG